LFLVFCGVQVIAITHGYKGAKWIERDVVESLPVRSTALGAVERKEQVRMQV
jgi:hypothetical protein